MRGVEAGRAGTENAVVGLNAAAGVGAVGLERFVAVG